MSSLIFFEEIKPKLSRRCWIEDDSYTPILSKTESNSYLTIYIVDDVLRQAHSIQDKTTPSTEFELSAPFNLSNVALKIITQYFFQKTPFFQEFRGNFLISHRKFQCKVFWCKSRCFFQRELSCWF